MVKPVSWMRMMPSPSSVAPLAGVAPSSVGSLSGLADPFTWVPLDKPLGTSDLEAGKKEKNELE